MKKTLDYYFSSLEKYLQKYYQDYDQSNWNRWMQRIIKPLFEGDIINWKRMEYNVNKISNQDNFELWFAERVKKMNDAYQQLKETSELDDEILLFVSYLASMGFFEDINMSMDDWLNSKRINQDGTGKSKKDRYSINKLSQYDLGSNLIKEKLISLDWHKR